MGVWMCVDACVCVCGLCKYGEQDDIINVPG